MNHLNSKQIQTIKKQTTRVIYVWDGIEKNIVKGDNILRTYESPSVKAIHVVPHEYIYAYNTVGRITDDAVPAMRRIHRRFNKIADKTLHLSEAKFEILFGDRIFEVVRMSQILKPDVILMPRFVQSGFSAWIHGNLNTRIVKQVDCEVSFYDSQTK